MFPENSQLLLFLVATVILNLTPGNDVLYVASQSLHNRRHGMMAALGVSTGIGIYVLATALGLAEILRYSPTAFNVIKYVGGAYLLFLAWQLFFKPETQTLLIADEQPLLGSYYRGIYTTLLNPKVGIFFITFLPQFVDVSLGKVSLQILSLGCLFVISGTMINFMYAYLFSYLKERLLNKFNIQKWLNKFIAFIFVGIAIRLFTSEQAN